jgi:hypothetical protein
MQNTLPTINLTRESRLRFALGALAIAILVATALLVASFVGGSIG